MDVIRWGGSQLGIMATPPREIVCMFSVLMRGDDDDDDDDEEEEEEEEELFDDVLVVVVVERALVKVAR